MNGNLSALKKGNSINKIIKSIQRRLINRIDFKSLCAIGMRGIKGLILCVLLVGLEFIHAQVYSRDILCLYRLESERDLLKKGVEPILNHLGYKVTYFDSESSFSEITNPNKFHAIVIWSETDEHSSPDYYLSWLTQRAKEQQKIIIFGHLPGKVSERSQLKVNDKIYNTFLNAIGLNLKGKLNRNPLMRKFVASNPKMTEFERKFEDRLISIPKLKGLHSSVVQHAYFKTPTDQIPIVLTSRHGGLALNPCVYAIENLGEFRRQWVLNPFLFLKESLGKTIWPIPDVTTINGRRVFYSHVDGDAFHSVCQFDNDRISAEVVYDEVLKHFPYPHTLSLVLCWFDPNAENIAQTVVIRDQYRTNQIKISKFHRSKRIAYAKKLFSHEWVEPAIHGYGHPFKWKDKMLANITDQRPFSTDDEFVKAAQLMTDLILEKREKPGIFLWTGDCLPTRKQLEASYQAGLININGSDPIYDAKHNSTFYLEPLYRKLGNYLQVYASACNEMLYTNGWTEPGPFYGFRNVVETFIRTDQERRLAPINIYYHWYSGEKKSSVQALYDIYSWVKTQETVPVFASRHVRNVHGFYHSEFSKINDAILLKNNGSLKTLRLDPDTPIPEIGGDTNIIGYLKEKNRTWLHLGPKDNTIIRYPQNRITPIHLKWATCVVQDLKLHQEGFTLDLWGHGDSDIVIDTKGQTPIQLKGIHLSEIKSHKYLKIKLRLKGQQTLKFKWTPTP